MKVLFLNQHYLPEVAPTGLLLAELAEDLAASGVAVSVLTGLPSYLLNGVRKVVQTSTTHENGPLQVSRIWNTGWNRHTRIGRLMNYGTFYCGCALNVMVEEADVVVAMTTPPLLSALGATRKKLLGGKLILWMQDVYPDIAFRYNAFDSAALGRSLRWISEIAHGAADAIVALGETMENHLQEIGVPAGKVRVIHNWADGRSLHPDPAVGSSRREILGFEGKFVILYSGNMGMVHDFSAVFSAARRLACDPRVLFLFAGNGVQRKDLEDIARRESLPNVKFLGYAAREELNAALNVASASLVTQDELSLGLVVPSKIYSSLAVGRPVLAIGPKGSEVESILTASGAGFFHENGDGEGLLQAIRTLLESAELAQEMGDRGRKYFLEHFDRPLQTTRFRDLLLEICRD